MSLQIRVTGLIAVLNTAVIVAFGAYHWHENKARLTEATAATGQREIETLSSLTGRALIDRDDLALSDALQNLQGLSGFVYAAAYGAETKNVILSRSGKAFANQAKETETGMQALVKENWQAIVATGLTANIPAMKAPSGISSNGLRYYHKAAYHPFARENPPLLAVVQIAVSDENLQKAIRRGGIEVVIACTGIFFLGGIAAFYLAGFIIRLVRSH